MQQEDFVDIDGARLRCLREGPQSDDAPWIVFGNSLLTNLTVWDGQVAALSARWRVLRYDQRGHGKSSLGASPAGIARMGADLVALLERFDIRRCTYVGVSMGVPTGLAAHALGAERFERLVFSDGQAATAPSGAAGWAERIAFARAEGMERFADATVARWLGPEAAGDDRGQRLRAMLAATSLEGFVHGATALQDYDFADEVPRIACPLLAIAGAKDGAMPEGMARTFGAVPGARVEVVADAGHLPNFERPDAFNAVLLDFLETRP